MEFTPSMVSCDRMGIQRRDNFIQAPLIPGSAMPSDYTKSGYSRGHLFNWDEAKCDGGTVKECFYMSNMLPQNQSFNAGDWGTVEKYERALTQTQTIHIIAGGYGSIGTTLGGVNKPQYIWKAIYASGKWFCWMMLNDSSSVGHSATQTMYHDLASFNNMTGLHLK